MRKLFLVALCAIAVAGLVFFYAAPSMAVHKNPGNQLVCGGCHTMHNSQGNSSLGGNTDGSLILLRGAVTTRADVHMLCLQCHASNGAQNTTEFPDEDAIGDGNHPAPKVFIMGAGGYGNDTSNAVIDDFTCTSCHDPHGTFDTPNTTTGVNVYRNLKMIPRGSGEVTNVVLNTNIRSWVGFGGAGD